MKDLFGIPLTTPENHLTFRQWQLREGYGLYRSGAPQMSNTHLLAHLIHNYPLAERLMAHFGNLRVIAEASLVELKQVKGVGIAAAETIHVAFELSQRLMQMEKEPKPTVSGPADIFELVRDGFRDLKQEVLKVLLLDTKNRVASIETVFIGTLNASVIHPREIFKVAIRQSAASIVLTHNHPSGMPEPSAEDVRVTQQIAKAGDLIQIPLLDHLVIGDGYLSMRESGLF